MIIYLIFIHLGCFLLKNTGLLSTIVIYATSCKKMIANLAAYCYGLSLLHTNVSYLGTKVSPLHASVSVLGTKVSLTHKSFIFRGYCVT